MKSAWLIKMNCENHTYDYGVMICEEEKVKNCCERLTEESIKNNKDTDCNYYYFYSYHSIKFIEE